MKGKSLNVLPMMVFGIGGITILALTWTRPVPVSEWLLNSTIGFTGIGWAIFQFLFGTLKRRTQSQQLQVEIESEYKH